MPFRAALLAAGLLCLAALSCTDRDGRTATDEAEGSAASGDRKATAEPGSAPSAPDPVEPLADGSHGVYGLRVPRGMIPARGPNKVYRFEGTLQLEHLKRYVMRQVETGTIIEEPTGYLIRKARVVEPVGTPDPSTRLAVRIFRGRRGGASMDVWVEIDHAKLKQAGGYGLGGVGGSGASDDRKPAQLSSSQARARAEDRKKTFEMIQAAAEGKAVPRDPENPLHY